MPLVPPHLPPPPTPLRTRAHYSAHHPLIVTVVILAKKALLLMLAFALRSWPAQLKVLIATVILGVFTVWHTYAGTHAHARHAHARARARPRTHTPATKSCSRALHQRLGRYAKPYGDGRAGDRIRDR